MVLLCQILLYNPHDNWKYKQILKHKTKHARENKCNLQLVETIPKLHRYIRFEIWGRLYKVQGRANHDLLTGRQKVEWMPIKLLPAPPPPPAVVASQSRAASRHRWGVSRCRYSLRGARTGPVRDLVARWIRAQLQCQTIRLEWCCIICPSVLLRPWPQRNLALRVQRFDNGYDYQFSFCPKKFLCPGSHWSAFKMMVENLYRASQTSHVTGRHRTQFGKKMTGFVCWLRLAAFV